MLTATYQREQLTEALISEVTPLISKHYKEIAHYQDIPLNPNWDQYLAIQENNASRLYTARDDNGVIIGYACFFVRHNPHYSTSLQAVNDVIFIDKERRGFGREFIAWCDEQLRADGVQVVYHHIKFAHDWSPILRRMGYEEQDKIMSRRLDR